MKITTNHHTYGTIVYNESFWTGKKEVSINGKKLSMQKKNTFLWNCDGQSKIVTVKGSFVTGTKLILDGEEAQLTASPKWYEIICSVMIFAFIMVWGNSIALCKIVPIVGGAIGGGISGAMAFLNLTLMKSQKNIWMKLIIWLAMLAATVALCHLAAIAFLSVL